MAEKKNDSRCRGCGGKHATPDKQENCDTYQAKHSSESIKRWGHPFPAIVPTIAEFVEWLSQFNGSFRRTRG